MATDIERLVVQLSADFKAFEREMQRASGISDRQARAIENNFRQANKRLEGIGRGMASAITGPLAGIGAALSTKQVLDYADQWQKLQNSLAVAGVTGAKQAAVLDELFKSAQANGAPISALTTLYGRAAQVSTELGASQSDLIRFSDGVATALRVAGSDASQASGALMQLGQALGSGTVRAEEFNSVQEGARPILQAVAAGLQEAGGSVAKLKELVNEGKVSSKQFFDAFLKGLPTIQAQAGQAAQTISQAYTKINNALVKYIGETDQSLGASQRLVAGLNVLADNFGKTADVILKVAAVVAAVFVGRAIAGMISALGLGVAALANFVAAVRAAGTAAALGSLAAAANPLGLVIGTVVVGALALYATSTTSASAASRGFAAELAKVQASAQAAKPAVDNLARSMTNLEKDALFKQAEAGGREIEALVARITELMSRLRTDVVAMKYLTPEQRAELERIEKGLRDGTMRADEARAALDRLAGSGPQLANMARYLDPLISRLADLRQALANTLSQLAAVGNAASGMSQADIAASSAWADQESIASRLIQTGNRLSEESRRRNALTADQLKLEDKIAEIRKRSDGFAVMSRAQLAGLAQAEIDAEKRRSNEGGGGGSTRQRRTTDDAFNREIQQIKDRTAALVLEQEIIGKGVAEQERRRMELELEQQALRRLQDAARQNGDTNWRNIQLSQQQRDAIRKVSEAYGEQAAALQRVQENQQRAQQAAEEFYSAAKQGFIDSITGAKSLGDAIGNLAKKLGNLLIGGAFDALFKPAGGGGLFGGILKLFGGGGGGGLNPFSLFSEGGYTGDGGKYQPAGTVHRGEYVFSKEATRRAGVGNLEAMHRSLKGYATGGLVGGAAPRPPTIPAMLTQGGAGRGATVVQMGDTIIDARNSSLTEAQFRAILAENNKQVLSMVPAAVMKARGSRDLDTRR